MAKGKVGGGREELEREKKQAQEGGTRERPHLRPGRASTWAG
jgi:hypothetical protein